MRQRFRNTPMQKYFKTTKGILAWHFYENRLISQRIHSIDYLPCMKKQMASLYQCSLPASTSCLIYQTKSAMMKQVFPKMLSVLSDFPLKGPLQYKWSPPCPICKERPLDVVSSPASYLHSSRWNHDSPKHCWLAVGLQQPALCPGLQRLWYRDACVWIWAL